MSINGPLDEPLLYANYITPYKFIGNPIF